MGLPVSRPAQFFNTKRGRTVLENLTAYAFLAPAAIIIFVFGIFPVAFAFFVSLHRWRRFPDEYRGLDSYVDAIGNFGYVVFFWLAIGFMVAGLYMLWQLYRQSDADTTLWQRLIALIPSIALTASTLAFVNWFFILLPFVLDVPRRLQGQEKNTQIFVGEFFNSFQFPEVLAAATMMNLLVLAGVVITGIYLWAARWRQHSNNLVIGFRACIALAAGYFIFVLTLSEIQTAIAAAQEAGEGAPIWTQIIMISAGAGLIGFALLMWQSATDTANKYFFPRAMVTVAAVIGGVLLVMFLPPAFAGADRDVLQGFNVTVMYSLFAVPTQLSLGLLLAVLLFQKIRFKSFFRIVYFLPYITPFVATSIVFSLLFSHRAGSPINQLLRTFGIEEQNWLLEPRGIFELIFGEGIPEFLVGPGLALVVIIIFSIWVYAGYCTVIFLAGLGNVPEEVYEASRIDGANWWNQFRHITIPLLSPTIFFLILISTIGTFQAFTQVFLMRQPGVYDAVDTINIYIYNEIQTTRPNYAYGSAMAFVLFAVILVLTIIQNRVAGRRVFYG